MKKLAISLIAINCQSVMAASSPSAVAELAALDVSLPALEDISTTHPVFDFDGDGTVGVASETVENDKFVELITDNIGSVIIKINGNDEQLFPTYNSEKINTNNFSELKILAADTNLKKKKKLLIKLLGQKKIRLII